jgi:hypothetical protein
MASIDDPLAWLLTEQIGEIDEEIKQYTKDFNSVQCSEHSTTPQWTMRSRANPFKNISLFGIVELIGIF